jgi:hypothetical protein
LRTVAGQNAMPNEQTLANSLSQDSVGVRQLLAEKQHHNATSPFLRCAKQNTYWPGTRLCCRPYRDAACVTKAGSRKPETPKAPRTQETYRNIVQNLWPPAPTHDAGSSCGFLPNCHQLRRGSPNGDLCGPSFPQMEKSSNAAIRDHKFI